jgi:enoyl-CoA hydratase/carnithine racemase
MLEIINHGPVREIRLARPPVNALNPELVENLTLSLRDAQAECDAVVLSGQQGMFSAGLDVIELLQLERDAMAGFWRAFFVLLETLACSPLPVAAAITGHSPAGGAVMCLMTDYRVMSTGNFKIGLNETRVGLIIPSLLHRAMGRLVGTRLAEHMVVAGTVTDPGNALKIGLVDALETGYEATIQRAVNWCEQLLSLPRQAMLGNRATARAHFKQEFAEYANEGVGAFVDAWFSDEAQRVMHELVAQFQSKK